MINFHRNTPLFSFKRLSKLFRHISHVRILFQFGIFCGVALLADYYSNYRIAHGLFRRIWTNHFRMDLSKNCNFIISYLIWLIYDKHAYIYIHTYLCIEFNMLCLLDFLSAEQLSNGKFLVDNDKCRIPDINIWNSSDQAYLKKVPTSPYKCECNQVNLTYVKGQVRTQLKKILSTKFI